MQRVSVIPSCAAHLITLVVIPVSLMCLYFSNFNMNCFFQKDHYISRNQYKNVMHSLIYTENIYILYFTVTCRESTFPKFRSGLGAIRPFPCRAVQCQIQPGGRTPEILDIFNRFSCNNNFIYRSKIIALNLQKNFLEEVSELSTISLEIPSRGHPGVFLALLLVVGESSFHYSVAAHSMFYEIWRAVCLLRKAWHKYMSSNIILYQFLQFNISMAQNIFSIHIKEKVVINTGAVKVDHYQ